VLAFAGLLALAAGLGSGLLPALRTWAEAGAPAERAGTMGRGGARLRRALVASQLALALVLLVGAGLLLRSFERLLAVDLGFESGERVVAPLRLRGVAYDEARARDLRERLAARLAGRPEVSAVAFADPVPLTGASHATTVPIEGYEPPDGRPRAVRYSVVSASYFATLGVGLDAGRGFGGEDRPGSPPVAVVDRTFADRFWPGRQAVGRRLFVWDAWHTVVGVSEPVRYLRPDEQPEPQFYLSLEQHPQRAVQVVVAGGPGAAAALREELAALDPDLPLPVEALADAVGRAFDRHRYLSLAVACFAGVALLLAALGTYGVMASSVAGRTREIGVQMALGARREAVLRGVMREGLALVAVATVAGLAGGWALSRALAGLLYQVSPGDPASYALVTLLLAAVALVACWLPARRAAAVEPLAALRWE
jgi:predicted permease